MRGILLLALLLTPASVAAIDFEPVAPVHGETIVEREPTIILHIDGNGTNVRERDITLTLDGVFKASAERDETFSYQDGNVTWRVPEFLALNNGVHTIQVVIVAQGKEEAYEWNFTVDPSLGADQGGVDAQGIVIGVASAFALALLAVVGYGVYLWQVKGWTWRKFLIKYPFLGKALGLYLPVAVTAVLVIGGLLYVTSHDTGIRFAIEYLVVGGLLVGLLPYTVQSVRGRGKRRAYERAFAQFLFELADAMRGGLDPVKAIRELGSNAGGVLRKPLKRAADGLKLGRSMTEVFDQLAGATGSPLVKRYSGLLNEAAKAGGDISMVVFRAAKDLEELTKIELERARAMRGPVMTMYIAFGVLFLITSTLVDFAPKLGEVDFTSIGAAPDDDAPSGPTIDIDAMETRFYHLLLVASMGTGLLVGAFTDGNIRFGLHHMLVMGTIAIVAYPLFVV